MGAEVCDLAGLFLLQHLQVILTPGFRGIYCDDGLAVLHKASNSEQELHQKNQRNIQH